MDATPSTETTKPKKSKKDTAPRQWTERLDVPMTEKELAALAPRIDAAIAEVESLEEQLLCKKSEFKAQIELAESRVRELRHDANTGKKKADVKVIERFIFATNTAEVVRLDTNEVIRSRALTSEERQVALPIPDAAAASVDPLANGKKAERPKSADGRCAVEIRGERCVRDDGHRGAHGLGKANGAKASPKEGDAS